MTATAVIAPSASSRKMRASTRRRPASERRTVSPEKKTVLPAVAVVVVTAQPGIGAPDQLLPETVDDEQRVVDTDAEPDHGGDVRDEQVELGECRRRAEHAEGDDHPGHRQHQRQTGRDHGARGDQEDQERDWKSQPLRPREILLLLGDELGDQR